MSHPCAQRTDHRRNQAQPGGIGRNHAGPGGTRRDQAGPAGRDQAQSGRIRRLHTHSVTHTHSVESRCGYIMRDQAGSLELGRVRRGRAGSGGIRRSQAGPGGTRRGHLRGQAGSLELGGVRLGLAGTRRRKSTRSRRRAPRGCSSLASPAEGLGLS